MRMVGMIYDSYNMGCIVYMSVIVYCTVCGKHTYRTMLIYCIFSIR